MTSDNATTIYAGDHRTRAVIEENRVLTDLVYDLNRRLDAAERLEIDLKGTVKRLATERDNWMETARRVQNQLTQEGQR